MKKIWMLAFVVVLLVGALAACNLLRGTPNGTVVGTPDLINTAAALTVQAVQTELAKDPIEAGYATMAPTWTVEGQQNALETPVPSPTPLPTWTPIPSHTPLPPATATPSIPCNQMSFVRDYTIPDGTWMQPSQTFTKIWEVRNSGSCTWDAGYSIVFTNEGIAMGAPASQPISESPIRPGEVLRVALSFNAPSSDGEYNGRWRLRSSTGVEFGSFWVKINVDGNTGTFVLADRFCSAEWRNSTGILPCPGKAGDTAGSVITTDRPRLENGVVDDENSIIMALRKAENDETRGEFFKMRMPDTPARFRALIGCAHQRPACDVVMTVKYRIAGESGETQIGQWNERFDNNMTLVDIDLTPFDLEGKLVHWVLSVHANGSPNDDEVFWLYPRIVVP